MYKKYFKRFFDFVFSLFCLLIFSPFLLILTIVGFIEMKGNPFFSQERPGKDEHIFKLFKFRTMTNERDVNGELLPDEKRLNRYGLFLRSTSLDELPELVNIFLGQMSFIGPRPLLVPYLPWYTEEHRRRHSIRPGLTGYAQAHGRNAISWDEKFDMDIWYIEHLTFSTDIHILLDTLISVIKREGISSDNSVTMESYIDYCKRIGRTPRNI